MTMRFLLIAIVVIALFAGCIGPSPPHAIPFLGWLFIVDTESGKMLFFVTEGMYSGNGEIYTESQVQDITGLSKIMPSTETKQTLEEARIIAVSYIWEQGSRNFTRTQNDCKQECTDMGLQSPPPSSNSLDGFAACVQACLNNSDEWVKAAECTGKLEVGDEPFLDYNPAPYEWRFPLYNNGSYQGFVSVDDEHGYIGSQFNPCWPGYSALVDYPLPTDTVSRSILLLYLEENAIKGVIHESYRIRYLRK